MNNKNQINFISKENSKYIYGICILMMLWHHLFGFPERFDITFTSLLGSSIFQVYIMIGYFCKLCVSIYAFMTGYGLMIKFTKKTVKLNALFLYIFRKICSFYKKYWLALILFLLIGILLNKRNFEIIPFLKNAIGLSCTYNEEWWYISYYLRMLMVFPIIYFVVKKIDRKYIVLLLVTALIYYYSISWKGAQVYLSYLFGILFAVYDDYLRKMINYIKDNLLLNVICIILCVVMIIPIRLMFNFGNDINCIFSAIFIFGLVCLLEWIKEYKIFISILLILENIGKQNLYMWLTHTFFLYYYFKSYFEVLKNGMLAFVVLVLVSYLTSILMNYIYNRVFVKEV